MMSPAVSRQYQPAVVHVLLSLVVAASVFHTAACDSGGGRVVVELESGWPATALRMEAR